MLTLGNNTCLGIPTILGGSTFEPETIKWISSASSSGGSLSVTDIIANDFLVKESLYSFI